ncbi:MAG: hypothetical protein RIT81_06840 [Deltaproteobacteria bacterium]
MGRRLLAVAVLLSTGCVAHYEDALGYRARQATLRRDVPAFSELMAEAADTLPSHPYDNPKKTVLTHFLDLAGEPGFFEMIDAWRKREWVSEYMTCAIHRARYRGMRDKDFEEATRAANVCIDQARSAAYAGDRSWELEVCLEEAPFLTETSTATLRPYLLLAADATEPRVFRKGVVSGMTHLYVMDAYTRRANDPSLDAAGALAQTERAVGEVGTRLRSILDVLRIAMDTTLLAAGSAFGASELERVSLSLGESFIGTFADSDIAEAQDLAWAWVRSMKVRERDRRLSRLSLWDRRREPKSDAYWYLCSKKRVDEVFSVADVRAVSVRATQRVEDPEAFAPLCVGYPSLAGPYPLEATARGTLTASVARTSSVARVRLSIAARKTLK